MTATKVIAIHGNYRSRSAELGNPVPSFPSYFFKPPSTITGNGAVVERPLGCELLVSEGEIAVVIGTRAHHVRADEAWSYVAAVAPANDFGVHDLRWCDRGSNVRSKGWDGCTPIGPLVDASTVDPRSLHLRSTVNGEVRQDATLADDGIFGLADLVADLSTVMTLESGDVILTGTPAGARPVQPGDVVTVELVGHSVLTCTIAASTAAPSAIAPSPKATPSERAAAYARPAPAPAAPRPVTLSTETRARLERLSTATITNQLQRRGIQHTFLSGLRPSHPERKMVGYARTLRYVPLREDQLRNLGGLDSAQRRAVESIGTDEVLVIEARNVTDAATIGDILVMRCLARGAAGVVTDGGLRDTPAIYGIDLPVYHRSSHAATLQRRHLPLDVDVPIACAETLVFPGDIVVGDGEGVVVIPAALVDEVARDAEVQEDEEAFALERVTAGESTLEVFPLSAARRAEYEAWRTARAD